MRKRVEKLRERMKDENIEAFLITDATNRRYVSGFTGTAGVVLITKDSAQLITDFRYVTQAQEQAPYFELIRHKGAIWETVVRQCGKLGIQSLAFEEQQLTFAHYRELQRHTDDIDLKPTSNLVENLRLIKDEQELEILQKAAQIADRTYEHILTFLKNGLSEREVSVELEFTMRKLGAASTSFETIVASGQRSALPHGVASHKRIEAGDIVTLDFGALYEGYCSDITRTVIVGEANDKQREIYDIVLTAQTRVVEHLKPGMTGREADAIARDYITEKGYGDYFGHSTGHGLGLNVHEGPTLSYRSETVLQPGMVVTVEPGIYVPKFGGVRIEDDVVITELGCRRLTNSSKQLVIL